MGFRSMKQTRKERKAKKKEQQQQAIIAGEVLKQLDPDQERHDRKVAAIIKAGLSFKQINEGRIIVHFRGERGDEVSFSVVSNYYGVLHAMGAFDPHSYFRTVDKFYGAWRSYLITQGAWGGVVDAAGGEDLGGTPLALYSMLMQRLSKEELKTMQYIANDRDVHNISDTERSYLMYQTGEIEATLKGVEKIMQEAEQILLAQPNYF